MNSDFNKQLEERISRELKGLPDLSAPERLATSVMARIEKYSALPWYRQSWQAWPVGARFAAFAILLALFGGLCFVGSELLQAQSFNVAMRKAGEWRLRDWTLSGIPWPSWQTPSILMVKKLGAGFIIACLVVGGALLCSMRGLGNIGGAICYCPALKKFRYENYQLESGWFLPLPLAVCCWRLGPLPRRPMRQ